MSSSEPLRAGLQNEMTQEEKEDVFIECFMHEVESWFTANIACCDNRYDDFVAQWPYAYSANDAEFQCNSIDVRTFYSGSRLSEWYSEDEYNSLLPPMKCPNCGEPLASNFWPYELPFAPPEDYDTILEEIAHLASETPFLLPEHPFCVKVREALSEISKKCGTSQLDDFLFRGRSLQPDCNPTLEDFDFPPPKFVKEGRYNHAGDPVLYLASSESVCRAEMRDEKHLYIAKFRFKVSLKILDLMYPNQVDYENIDTLSFIVYSTLLSAKSMDNGFSRPEYVFSRFVKDCAKILGFDAIRYPSTRVGAARFNIVIINKNFTLTEHASDSTFFFVHPTP